MGLGFEKAPVAAALVQEIRGSRFAAAVLSRRGMKAKPSHLFLRKYRPIACSGRFCRATAPESGIGFFRQARGLQTNRLSNVYRSESGEACVQRRVYKHLYPKKRWKFNLVSVECLPWVRDRQGAQDFVRRFCPQRKRLP